MITANEILWLIGEGGIPCLFHEITGLYCPGCGGTRAVKALLSGHPILSFWYHPLVLYCAAVALWFAAAYFIYWLTKNPRFRLYFGNGYVYVGVGIIAANFVYKNYMLLVRGIDVLVGLAKV